jgi:hypothetical protein
MKPPDLAQAVIGIYQSSELTNARTTETEQKPHDTATRLDHSGMKKISSS